MDQLRTALLTLTLACCTLGVAEASKLYRWVDDAGNVFYSDRVPPDEVEKQRSVLDKQGIQVETVDQAKSREQLMLEHERNLELERLRREQQKLIAAQEAKDRILLRTFSSESDITMARDNKLNALDVSIQILRTNIQRAKERLVLHQKDAADLERQGQTVSKTMEEDIASSRQRLQVHYGDMVAKEQEKEKLFGEYDRDMQRFRELKDIQAPTVQSEQDDRRTASLLQTVIPCDTKEVCDQLWKIAETYVQNHSTTKLQILSDIIILTSPPTKPDDVSITVSRIERKSDEGFMIFMDLQCAPSPSGKDHCDSDKVTAIKTEFPRVMRVEVEQIPAPQAAANPR